MFLAQLSPLACANNLAKFLDVCETKIKLEYDPSTLKSTGRGFAYIPLNKLGQLLQLNGK